MWRCLKFQDKNSNNLFHMLYQITKVKNEQLFFGPYIVTKLTNNGLNREMENIYMTKVHFSS